MTSTESFSDVIDNKVGACLISAREGCSQRCSLEVSAKIAARVQHRNVVHQPRNVKRFIPAAGCFNEKLIMFLTRHFRAVGNLR